MTPTPSTGGDARERPTTGPTVVLSDAQWTEMQRVGRVMTGFGLFYRDYEAYCDD